MDSTIYNTNNTSNFPNPFWRKLQARHDMLMQRAWRCQVWSYLSLWAVHWWSGGAQGRFPSGSGATGALLQMAFGWLSYGIFGSFKSSRCFFLKPSIKLLLFAMSNRSPWANLGIFFFGFRQWCGLKDQRLEPSELLPHLVSSSDEVAARAETDTFVPNFIGSKFITQFSELWKKNGTWVIVQPLQLVFFDEIEPEVIIQDLQYSEHPQCIAKHLFINFVIYQFG